MPKAQTVRIVEAPMVPPVRIRCRKGKRTKTLSGDHIVRPTITLSGGINGGELSIQTPYHLSNNPDLDTLEIGGLLATVSQWRSILLPLLGLAPPENGLLM